MKLVTFSVLFVSIDAFRRMNFPRWTKMNGSHDSITQQTDPPKIITSPSNVIFGGLEEVVKAIVQVANDRKAAEITVLDIEYISDLASYLMIVKSNNKIHNRAIVMSVEV